MSEMPEPDKILRMRTVLERTGTKPRAHRLGSWGLGQSERGTVRDQFAVSSPAVRHISVLLPASCQKRRTGHGRDERDDGFCPRGPLASIAGTSRWQSEFLA